MPNDNTVLLEDLRQHLEAAGASCGDVTDLYQAAARDIAFGELDDAERRLDAAERIDLQAAQGALANARLRLPFAAVSRAARGSMAAVRGERLKAARHYAAAARSLPMRSHLERRRLLMAEAALLKQLGEATDDPLSLTSAVDAYTAALVAARALRDPARIAETEYCLAEALVGAGGMTGEQSGDIRAVPHLESAIAYFISSNRQGMQRRTQRLLGETLARLSETRADARIVAAAIGCIEASLVARSSADTRGDAQARLQLAGLQFRLGELTEDAMAYRGAIVAFEAALTAEGGAPAPERAAVVTLQFGTALTRFGAMVGDAAVLRRGDAILASLAQTLAMAEHPHIWGAAMIGHAEALAALGAMTADADMLHRAESAYAIIATSAAGTFSRLVVAYAWSGRGNVLRSLAALAGSPEFLDAAANAKRQARTRFEVAGSGRGVTDMERELDAIYAEIRARAVPGALALTG